MPTLFRLIVIVGLLCAAIYGAMVALVTFVQPTMREFTVTVPVGKLPK